MVKTSVKAIKANDMAEPTPKLKLWNASRMIKVEGTSAWRPGSRPSMTWNWLKALKFQRMDINIKVRVTGARDGKVMQRNRAQPEAGWTTRASSDPFRSHR